MRVKAYAYNGVISYLIQQDKKRPLDLEALNELPRAFSTDGVMDYTKALKASLEKRLKDRVLDEGVL